MKYLLLARKYGSPKRGAHTTSIRFQTEHPNHIVYSQDMFVTDYEEQLRVYDKLIFVTQAPHLYSKTFNFISLNKIPHTVYIRHEYNNPLYNSCNNGFSYFRHYSDIKNFIPMITDFKVTRNDNDITLGFYTRVHVNLDAVEYFKHMLSNLTEPITLYTIGDNCCDFSQYPMVTRWVHTYDNVEFFSNITHYIYPMSSTFVDPFPNTILEAAQNDIQIVLPRLKGRTHIDGVDDIKTCISYHNELNFNNYVSNANCGLVQKNFRKFYNSIFDNNFNYTFDRNKYTTFYDWCCGEL